ncbi:MAG: flagellar basal body P-ring protein FlgI, partial [Porticoccaceae bacterium]|nr:flagellar basal body P-ring protein FlgI [Porticoccaceae bacterium]
MRKINVLLCLLAIVHTTVFADRIKDLTTVAGVRSNQIVGFGLVVGLAGTGDGKDLKISAQVLRTTLSGLGISIDGPISDFDIGDQVASTAFGAANGE